MFSSVVTDFWDRSFAAGAPIPEAAVTVTVTEQVTDAAALLPTEDGCSRVALSPAAAETSGLASGTWSAAEVRHRLEAAGITLDDTADLYYWPEHVRAAVLGQAPPVQERPLTAADADLFATFTAACSAADLDEAEVELDDWDVLGILAGDVLVAVASAYLVDDSRIADLGVITHPDHRGQGHGRALVHAFGHRLLAAGYEPQYRCDPDNDASAALARSVGLARFGTWTTPADD